MKSIKKIYIALAAVLILFGACVKPDNITPVLSEGGLLEVTTPSINFVIGENQDYNVEFKIFQQADIKTTKVDAYVRFYTYKRNTDGTIYWEVTVDENGKADSTKVAIQSNEKLLTSIDITETVNYFESFTVGLSDLASDLSVEGNDYYTTLPTVDSEYLIGDTWEIRLVNTLSTGDVHENYKKVGISVSTRFAGTYKVIEASYFRLGVYNAAAWWTERELTIKSVDATTYVQTGDWYGFGDDGSNDLFFQIDAVTNKITYLENQALNGQPLLTVEANPGDLTNVIPLGGVNINSAIKDDVEGKDQLNMVYGYYTAGSGPREFYLLLQKKVN